jgi:type II secretory ATPase GspE/PulE/Tfp pilus assembly ATPase PilB-like protein
VRRICPQCKRETKGDAILLERLGLAPDAGPFYDGVGCEQCSGTGYKGRLAIYEVMRIDPTLASLVRRDAGVDSLRNAAIEGGMATLRADGLRKARAGDTTLREVYEATVRDS